MRAMGRNIGRVLDSLEESGIVDDTIVILLNDNGGPSLTAAVHSYNQASNAPLRGHKFDCWEGGIRTPMVIRWPGAMKPGSTFDPMVSSMDILPTLVAAAGGIVPDSLDGVDLLPRVAGETEPHEFLCWQNTFANHEPQAAIRKGRSKLHAVTPILQRPTRDDWRLYDLSSDVGETSDIARQHPDVVDELSTQWMRWRAEMLDPVKPR